MEIMVIRIIAETIKEPFPVSPPMKYTEEVTNSRIIIGSFITDFRASNSPFFLRNSRLLHPYFSSESSNFHSVDPSMAKFWMSIGYSY
jgi:hypothetical protein